MIVQIVWMFVNDNPHEVSPQNPTAVIADYVRVIKRPDPEMYKVLKEHNALSQLSAALLAEAEVLQSTRSQEPAIV
jgi:hypothetical protein